MFKNTPNIKSREGLVLRFMREERKLSLPTVALSTGIKASVIDHMENGNKILTEKDIELFLQSYDFSKEVFTELMAVKLLNKHAANLCFLKRKTQ
jgi:transcriptional regulator with XRE-family HTH domain